MKVFDLHCDTVGECSNRGLSLFENRLHLDLKRCNEIGDYTQVFAIWIPDELRGREAVEYFEKCADYYREEMKKNSTLLSPYGGKTSVKGILSVEGGSACGGTIEGLYHLYERGVRLITLTWNSENEICGGAFSDGGFTDFGKEFVKECGVLGITIDVSHLNRRSFKELCCFYEGPFIASHSNADIIDRDYAHKRNLSNWQIYEIKQRGGLIGLNYYTEFLESEECKGIDALKKQIDYFVSIGCENIIALGSDFDGCDIGAELSGVEKLKDVYYELQKTYGTQLADAVFYKNARSYFENLQ